MKTVLVHPFGNPFSYQAAFALHEQGWLEEFHTCLFNPGNSGRRCIPELLGARIRQHRVFEWLRLACTKLPAGGLNGRSPRFVDLVGTWCDRKARRSLPRAVDAVYCYEDFALHSFRQARLHGIDRIYDLPICFYKATQSAMAAEIARDADLQPFALVESEEKLCRKQEEIELATRIFCASSFTRETIPAEIRARTPVVVVPYGSDTAKPCRTWNTDDLRGKLKLLFVGSLGPRKGIHVLFKALDRLSPNHYELSLAGRWIPGFESFLNSRFRVTYQYLGQLQRSELNYVYLQNHVLVFPSLAEGFGLVLLEAMASGMPILTTERTAGPDLLQDGGGYLVNAGDAEALRFRLEYMLSSRQEFPAMSRIARQVAEQHSWERYRFELIQNLSWAPMTAISVA